MTGTFPVKCSINNRKGTSQNVTVVEAKITEGFWNDFGGSEISRARWRQTVDYCIKGQNIEGEQIELHIYDDDNPPNDDDFAYSNTENNKIIVGTNNKGYTFHSIELNDTIKNRTTNITSDEVKLYAKAKLIGFNSSLIDITEKKDTQKHLTVNNEEEVYRAIIGDKNGRARHNPVDYDIISWVYANTTYPKDTKLKVKIFENTPWYEFDQKCDELEVTGTVKEDGTLVTEVNWGKLKDAKQNKKTENYYAKIYNEDDDELLDGKESGTLCSTVLTPQSDLLKEASYVGAVTVGSQNIQQPSNENGVCECEAKVRAFMRMLRKGEGTQDEGGYSRIVGGTTFASHGKDFSDHPRMYISAHDSTAAGAYQITKTNWNDNGFATWRTNHEVTDFSPESQDIYAAYLIIKKKKAFEKIENNDFRGTVEKCRTEWASLPEELDMGKGKKQFLQ